MNNKIQQGTIPIQLYGNLSTNPAFEARISYTNKYDISDNTSQFSIKLELKAVKGKTDSGYFTGHYTINGIRKEINYHTTLSYNGWKTIVFESNSKTTIQYDNLSWKVIPFELFIYGPKNTLFELTNGIIQTELSLEGNTSIPQVIQCNNFTDEEGPNVIYSIPDKTNLQELFIGISFDGSIDCEISYRRLDITKNSYQFVFTEEEKELVRTNTTHSKSRTAYIQLKSKIAGFYYYNAAERTLSIVNAEPIITPTVEDINPVSLGLTGDKNKMIRFVSNAKVSFNAEPQKHAAIVSQRIYNGGRTIYDTSGEFYEVESGDFTFYAQDSRGYVKQLVVSKETIPYVKLTCNLKAHATLDLDNTVKLNINIDGNYYNGSFGAVNNSITVWYRYKSQTTEWSAWITNPATFPEADKYSSPVVVSGLNNDGYFTIEACARDQFGDIYSYDVNVSTKPIFDWSATDFNFNVPVNFSKGFTNNEGEDIPEPDKPVDIVIASGITQGWIWRKWKSGYAECWKTYTEHLQLDNPWNNIYKSRYYLPPDPYPFIFSEVPNFTFGYEDVNGEYWISTHSPGGTKESTPAFQATRATMLGALQVKVNVYVMGKYL